MTRCPYHFITKHCPTCKWPFQCSTSHISRIQCAACESKK